MARIDVTVRGAGVFGLAIAWTCAKRGAHVRVVDPNGPGAGASGGILGALAPHAPENWNAMKAFQFESLIMADVFWSDVEATTGVATGYARTGRLQPIPNETALQRARTRERTAGQYWQGLAAWNVIAQDEAGQWRPQSPIGLLVRDTLSARIAPRQAVAALATGIRASGGEIVDIADDSGVTVLATGATGLRDFSRMTGSALGSGVKGQAALLAYDAEPDAPQIRANGLHIVPHSDGTVAVGSTTERDYRDPVSTDAQLDELIARAAKAAPQLAGARIVERWAGERPRSVTRNPILGPWPGRPGHYIANGGFKTGFGMAPKVAETIADLVLEDKNRVPDGFSIKTAMATCHATFR